ncbi:heterokaryon incompatibility protein-domain-containing protein [Cadophora sp. MPI-SDFR-AT-0126]|nr:heterokaryon incompatibility protein-domain-containing protein [Leotiomycetes sp. MPI-SDFR-AT-0126]
MPTRVIDVGDGDTARLVLIDKENIGQGARYIALSHCWGDLWRHLPEEKRDKWSTTPKGVQRKMEGFLVKELPQTFQDAIIVTRELGLRYLWIDSLCIIQGKDGDFKTEAKKMEAVFKNAYCTIAATSAEDSTKGFLNRPLKEEDSQYVIVPNSSHGKVYICTSINDFPGDVEEGPLNMRAWVLQERALSRRTIHFTKRQTYWECGGGARCETLTHMKNAKLSFRSDPDFPRSIQDRSLPAQIRLFQSLFEDYSDLGLTYEKDRPIAIESLAKALTDALDTEVRYGIFECFLHRSLLWQRTQNIPLRQISSYSAGKAPHRGHGWHITGRSSICKTYNLETLSGIAAFNCKRQAIRKG